MAGTFRAFGNFVRLKTITEYQDKDITELKKDVKSLLKGISYIRGELDRMNGKK